MRVNPNAPGPTTTPDPAPAQPPRQVLLFSGHLMDAPGRAVPRFPPAMEPAAAHALAEVLDQTGAGPADLALCQAAAGGDLLFLEACVARGVRCQVLLPFDEATFIARSMWCSVGGPQWQARWEALKPRLGAAPQVMDQVLGTTPAGEDPFERCNGWLLESALGHGTQKLRLVLLWNGEGGDGPGGTRDMMARAEGLGAPVYWVDTRQLAHKTPGLESGAP